MSISQPYIVRIFFSSEREVHSAISDLNSQDLFGDYVHAGYNEPGKWKVIFANDDLKLSVAAIKALSVKPQHVDVFNPAADWADGFKPLS
jgi:hypothetical protein